MADDRDDDEVTAASNPDLSFIRDLQRASTEEVFRSEVSRCLERLGYSDFWLYALDPPRRGNDPGQGMTTFPQDLLKAYYEARYYEEDIIWSYGRLNTASVFYSDLYSEMIGEKYKTDHSVANTRIRTLYISHGFDDLYLMPNNVIGRPMMFMVANRVKETSGMNFIGHDTGAGQDARGDRA